MSFISRIFGRKKDEDQRKIVSKNKELNLSVLGKSTHSVGIKIGDRYEIIEVMEGGMGVVLLCFDHLAELPVALKTFRPEFFSDREFREGFLRECNTWINLGHHIHVVRAHCVELHQNGEVYLVMDWVPSAHNKSNASLQSWLNPLNPLRVKQSLTFSLHIARGMRYAANKIPGLIHRDLKPDNILIGQDNLAKVTDFGLAVVLAQITGNIGGSKNLQLNSTQSIYNSVAGTPYYMAPEQWVPGEPLDQRTDIYAFGCILYEMLTGRKAFVGQNLDELAEAHVTGKAEALPDSLPIEVVELVQRCMATEKQKRFKDWGVTERAVAQVYKIVTGSEAPPEPLTQAESKVERISQGWSFYAIGQSYHSIGKYDAAAEQFQRMIEIGQTEQDILLIGAGLHYLGTVFASTGGYAQSLEYFERTLSLLEETGQTDLAGDTLRNLGNAHRDLGNIQNAIDCYEKSLSAAESAGDTQLKSNTLNSLGNLYRRQKKFQEALELYEQSLNIDRATGNRQGIATVLGNIGIVYRNMGDLQKAIEYQQEALRLAHELADLSAEGRALANIGTAFRDLKEHETAIEYHRRALAVAQEIGDKRGMSRSLYGLGASYQQLNKFEEAKSHYLQSLAISKNIDDILGIAEASHAYTTLLLSQGKTSDALKYAEIAAQAYEQIGNTAMVHEFRQLIRNIKQKSLQTDALWKRGEAFAEQGKWPEAIREYEALLKIQPDHVVAHYNLGNLYVQSNRINDAIEHYKLAFPPKLPEAHLQLGRIYKTQGKYDNAIRELKAALKIDANLEDAYIQLTVIYQKQGGVNKALREFQTMLRQQPDNSIIHYCLAVIYMENERWDESFREYQSAIRLNPNHCNSHISLGAIYMNRGDWNQAKRETETAIRIDPNNGGAHTNLAVIYRQLGQINQAIREAELGVQLGYPRAKDILAGLIQTQRLQGPRSFNSRH